ncbi:hypothetical protein HII36_03235 [Nonomuraea sp. NN258]|uniref:hypothetical protein n=1 Tax=Nonomuraea antri TaxID=2730852 RepID=UPI001568A2D0|nr:hypothetical protein [Nonomuraea antri]NRQ30853.1 hypothetical protein [Nonomuraea antri]
MIRKLIGMASATLLAASALAPAAQATTGTAAGTHATAASTHATAGLKTVYGWAKKSGNSAMILTPHKATLGEIGESGLPGWDLGKKTGKPIKIDYTEGLDFRQINKKCGKRAAGYPHDKYTKKGFGAVKCYPIDLWKLLGKGRLAVRVVYDPAGPMAVKVYELNLP